jgi:hypothetical protein
MVQFTLHFNYPAFRAPIPPAIQRESERHLLAVQATIRREMDQSTARAASRKGRHSLKREAPAKQSGRLYNDMEIELLPLGAQLNINAPYAIFLEPPAALDRPFAQVAVDDVRQRFSTIGL